MFLLNGSGLYALNVINKIERLTCICVILLKIVVKVDCSPMWCCPTLISHWIDSHFERDTR